MIGYVRFREDFDQHFLGTAMEGSGFLSKLFFTWVNPVIERGSKNQIRGPDDVVSEIHRRLGVNQQGMMSCQIPHTLAFEIGGQLFPVDPRDILAPVQAGNLDVCWPNVVSTDPPQRGFLYSWSLGDPFLKS